MQMVKKFSETQPVIEKENDRYQLKVGDKFTITGFVIQESKKYARGISKINGISGNGLVVKFWTTSETIHNQLDNIAKSIGIDAGLLNQCVAVEVFEELSREGRKYLSFRDQE